jgi:hypothetical protein
VKKNPHTGEDLGNGEQDREDIAERSQVNNEEKKVVGACMAEGSAFDSDPWVRRLLQDRLIRGDVGSCIGSGGRGCTMEWLWYTNDSVYLVVTPWA